MVSATLALMYAGVGAGAEETDAAYVRNVPASSLADALCGLVPGLDVSYDSASDDAVPRITIRGSFSESGSAVLVLVDGVEMPVEFVDPQAIEDIKVLKGGAAAAVYGARAAAGAIVITTRNSTASAGTDRFAGISAFAGPSAGTGTGEKSGGLRLVHDYRVSAGGGDSNFSYYFGGNYHGAGALSSESTGKNGMRKAGFTANANVGITEWLRYSLGLNYTYRKSVSPFMDKDDAVPAAYSPFSYTDSDLHYAVMRNDFMAQIAEGLTLNLSYAFSNDYNFMRDRSVAAGGDSGRLPAKDFYKETRVRLSDSDIRPSLNLDRTFSGLHHVSASAGADIQTGLHKKVSAAVGNLLDPDFSVLTMGDGDFEVGEKKNRYLQCGFYADAAYAYDGQYSVRVTFREDGSSRFPKAHRWAPSYAAEFGWNISESGFFSADRDAAGNLSLRYGFSSIANQSIGAMFAYYASVNTDAGMSGFLFDRSGLSAFPAYDYPVSPDLRAERVNTHNLGMDAVFLRGRLGASLELYARKVNDMINPAAVVSAMFGDKAPLMNCGSVSSFGVDVSLGWKDACGDLHYSVKAMFSDHSPAVRGIPDPRLQYSMMTDMAWRGIDFGVHADGVGSEGAFCLRNVYAGYTFRLPEACRVKSLRAGAAARNVWLCGIEYPMWILAALSVNF